MTGRRSGERLDRYQGLDGNGEDDRFGPAACARAATVVGRLAEQQAGLTLGRLDEQEVRRRASRQLGRPIVADDPGLRVLLADLASAFMRRRGGRAGSCQVVLSAS